ncbi:PREDICTED: probable 39S ribosomal protein L23, mitochondrial [Ceratosolen solmsi marchali]|uniref:Large ribosomal subunit protein uL23m n=1 Tax=Ceratosolen solmsi marchali TaxID=326594 RepID=A0AAJ6YMB0_9HYME|nr:PREDICTED: probable 39S ribosomal protein L23, mitochondrial [Ceratosolen solmsi marchali]
MSTRYYPLYQKGNPQLRIFLPNFWMKLVKPQFNNPPNIVEFHCSMQMTRLDIKNYLEKIYKIPIIKVNTRIKLGKFRRNELNTVIKDEDIKVAYAHLPRFESFEFPNMFAEQRANKVKDKQTEKEVSEPLKKKIEEHNKYKAGLPLWFQ